MEILITIAIWLGCGFLCEHIGNQKGQTHCFWYGFLLGILGVIIVLCLKDKSGEIKKEESAMGDKYENLARLQKLKEDGAINEVEFEIEKSKLLK